MKIKSGIKQSAKDTWEKKKQNIITANIAGIQEDLFARLSNVETIWRDVRRKRPKKHPAVPDIYDTQYSLPRNYTMDLLGQQFLVYDNEQSIQNRSGRNIRFW